MNAWHWLSIGLAGFGLILALQLLHRLGLWLDNHGWLYYRKKQPSSSPMSAWVGMHQFIEPGVKHVVQIKQARRSEVDEEADKERLLAYLLEALDTNPINLEVIRYYLSAAQSAGLDWKSLYEEAVQIQRSRRRDSDALIPSLEEVALME